MKHTSAFPTKYKVFGTDLQIKQAQNLCIAASVKGSQGGVNMSKEELRRVKGSYKESMGVKGSQGDLI